MLDIAENSVQAGARRIRISVRKEPGPEMLVLEISDDGRGMTEEECRRVSHPFVTSRTTRKVGMGISLLKQHAEMSGGSFIIQSEPERGTRVEASFGWDHPDRQPMGDLGGCWVFLASSHHEIEWELECRSGKGEFAISTSEIRKILEVDEIRGSELKDSLQRLIRNNLEEISLQSDSLTES
jgi:chemotaxis protein histidine kinase CheA